jgi:rieske iron-sulfur protein
MRSDAANKSPSITPCSECAHRINRRRVLMNIGVGSLGLGLMPRALLAQADPAAAPPQEGDFLTGVSDESHKPVRAQDVALGATPTHVYPVSQDGVVRNQNRFNELLLLRLDPSTLNAATLAVGADGVLAFSAICPHAGCTINEYIASQNVLSCDCHSSQFDPRDAGKVVGGPAARPLPPLDLKLIKGNLAVAKTFEVDIRIGD